MAITRYLKYLPLSGVFSLTLSLAYVLRLSAKNAWAGDAPSISSGPAKAVRDYIPIVYVTAASMILYYILLFNQSAVAFSEFNKSKMLQENKKSDDNADHNAPSLGAIKYGSDNANVLAANRLTKQCW